MRKLSMLLVLLAVPAYAEQFNFTIPVKLDKLLPAVQQVKVECRVFKAKPPDWMGVTGLVGSWNQNVQVDPTGSVNQTVQAKFDAAPTANPQDAKYYQCGIRLAVLNLYLEPGPASAQDATKAKPGTAFLARQEGFFPQH